MLNLNYNERNTWRICMKIIDTDGKNQDFIRLCHLLDDYLNEISGGEEQRKQYIPYNSLADIHDVIVAYDGDITVGCASFKFFAPGIAEVKRVFVKQDYRKKKIGLKLMQEIEIHAKKKGYTNLVLETGELLREATSLYRQLGYKVIKNYGVYKDMAESICMGKELP